ncbi:hypothetical protein GGS20DRAFT_45105 [Poronia punctata]|nr:hypothetical protein GGS20DRAFT_45105 [Poronia punctata]
MSGEPTTGRSASPQTSPKTQAGTGSSPYHTGLRGGGDGQAENRTLESAGIPRSHRDPSQQQPQPIPHRPLDVQTILNPTAENHSPYLGPRREGAAQSPKPSSSSPHGQSAYPFRGSTAGTPGQRTPTATPGPQDQLSAPPSAERGSPGAPRPLPAIAARPVLTPRRPRLMFSPGQRTFATLNPPQSQHFAVAHQESNPAMLPDTVVHGRPDQQQATVRGSPLAQQQFNGVGSAAGHARPRLTALPPSRSVSQPIQGQPNPHLHAGPNFGPGHPGIPPGPPPPYPRPVLSSTGYPGHAVDPRWAGGGEKGPQFGQGGARGYAFAEGQAALRIQSASGEEFIVPVDTHQGSRQADEKRQRNAGASARFRKRKKDRETMERMEHQRMENQYRELESQIRALEADRERLRSDRDRLRDIVYRTPDISDLAYQGPPSPVSSIGSSTQPRGSTYGASDPETGERASQRRRTDPHPQVEYSPSPYTSTPTSLPSIPSSAYPTSTSHPGTPSMRPRLQPLPPLRLGSNAGTPTTVTSATSTPAPAYQTIKREPYETGWATGRRGSTESTQMGPAERRGQ